jgi:hypothetical protein
LWFQAPVEFDNGDAAWEEVIKPRPEKEEFNKMNVKKR